MTIPGRSLTMPMSNDKPLVFFIQWHLTESCNLHCRHCYQAEPVRDRMSMAEIKKVLAEASDMITDWSDAHGIDFLRSMNISGGEPFLIPELLDILREAKRHGFEIHLLTNGTLIDRARARTMAGIGIDSVQVSIEGSQAVHDAIRGPGSFGASLKGIEHLVDAGINVTLNATVSRLNAGNIQKLIEIGSAAGVQRIGFSRLVPAGRGNALLPELLTKNELQDFYKSLLFNEHAGLEIVTGDPVAAQMVQETGVDAGDTAICGCAAAVSGLTVSPNGDVLPCRRLPVPLGNVYRDSLREIWALSPVLEALRDRSRYHGKCGTCARWAVCRGCRAVAYAWSGSAHAEDILAR